jgi:hypothetical protein
MSENKNDNNNNNISLKNIIPSGIHPSDLSPEKIDQIIFRLEKAIGKVDLLTSLNENTSNNYEEKESIPTLNNFWNYSQNLLQELKDKSAEANNVHFEELTEIFIESICFQQDILLHSFSFQKPGNEDMRKLLSILQGQIKKIEKILILEPSLSLQIELVQKGMNTLAWMFDTFKCDLIVNNNLGIVNDISNKIILMGNQVYIEWVNIFMKLMYEIVEFVNNNYKNGLIWSAQGNNNILELVLEIGNTYKKYFKNDSRIFQYDLSFNQIQENDKRNKMFEELKNDIKKKELNQKKLLDNKKEENTINNENNIMNNNENESNINKDNVQTIYDKFMELKEDNKEIVGRTMKSNSISHKGCVSLSCRNSVKDTGSGSYLDNSSKSGFRTGVRKKLLSMGKRDHYEERDNIILFENFDGLIKNIKPDILGDDTFVRITNCLNCTFKISKSINRIVILNCQNCKIICDKLFSNIEIVNNTQIIIQCNGRVHMANLEGSKDVMFLLSQESRNISIYCHHSTLIRVKTLKEDNEDEGKRKDYDEYIFPEQFEFGVTDDMKLDFNVVSI